MARDGAAAGGQHGHTFSDWPGAGRRNPIGNHCAALARRHHRFQRVPSDRPMKRPSTKGVLRFGGAELELGDYTYVMGVINLSPES